MKKLLFAAAALLVMSMPGKAAVITDLGVNPNSATGHFSNAVFGATFDDQYTFSLVGGPQFVAFASATNDFTASTDFITNFVGQLFSFGPNGIFGGGDDFAVNPPVAAVPCPDNPTGCQVLAGAAILDPGGYFLDISGQGGGTSGYGGNLTTAAFGVPGPLAGAGLPGIVTALLIGFFGWKRRRAMVA